MVYNIQSPDDHPQRGHFGAIRERIWKLHRIPAANINGYYDELYNLETDPYEQFDVSRIEHDVAVYMGDLFDQLSKSIVEPRNVPVINDNRNIDEDGYIQSEWCEL